MKRANLSGMGASCDEKDGWSPGSFWKELRENAATRMVLPKGIARKVKEEEEEEEEMQCHAIQNIEPNFGSTYSKRVCRQGSSLHTF
jgi:hypothetical protein